MEGNAVSDSSNVCVVIVQVAVTGGLDGRLENVLHLGIPELLGGLCGAHQEVRHPAAAPEPARLFLAAGSERQTA